MNQVDWLVLTAANRAQALGYEAQLAQRERAGRLSGVGAWMVVADPGGRRVGSGGSTLWVLYRLAERLRKARPGARSLAKLFAGQRIIIIHSGGDSRRLCAYAAQGKVFTPLPCDDEPAGGHPATLFDLISRDLAAMEAPEAGQVLIASGDVLLTFYRKEADFSPAGVVGVAYPGPAQRGAKHGVYVTGPDGKVTDFLQKPDEQTARAHGAVDAVGRVLVDTGIISLDPATVQHWMKMSGVSLRDGSLSKEGGLLDDVAAGRAGAIDLYEQMLMALPQQVDWPTYLARMGRSHTAQGEDTAQTARLRKIHRSLHGQPFAANVLPYCEFFHVGTTRELLSNISGLSRTAQMKGFENFYRAVAPAGASLEGAFIYNSILQTKQLRAGEGVLVEASRIENVAAELWGQNVVVGYPAEARAPLRLGKGWGLVCLPVRKSDWSVVLFGLDDDFKTPRDQDGTFGNEPINDFLLSQELPAGKVWSGRGGKQTLWEAKLWSVGPIDRVLRLTLWMMGKLGGKSGMPANWLRTKRVSMHQLLSMVNHDRLIAHRAEIQRLVDIHRLGERLAGDPWLPATQVIDGLQTADEAKTAVGQIEALLSHDSEPLRDARLHRLTQLIIEAFPKCAGRDAAARAERAAFAGVADAVRRQTSLPDKPREAAILPDQVIWATTPVRLDFAGGWSDTPPACTELGGTVVNAAITLNGQYPVQVMAKLNPDHAAVTLSSIDLGQRIELRDTGAILDYTNPADWAALPKAAMVLSGIAPSDAKTPLKRWLEKLGGGLDITIFSALPKGSGLGTSSVLGAAMLACLSRVLGQPAPNETLIAQTSMLEQLMTTGGGWQDQVGGITPGVKIIRTQPGAEQIPSLSWAGADLSTHTPLGRRLLLYYTGYKRLAKNILQNVVGRYLARDRHVVSVIHQLKDQAEQMKDALDRADVEAFGAGIERYWTAKKSLDPGATTQPIEKLIASVEDQLIGKVLPGAGGGGFVFMVARDEQAARRVRKVLNGSRPNKLARFFDFSVDGNGLRVTVL